MNNIDNLDKQSLNLPIISPEYLKVKKRNIILYFEEPIEFDEIIINNTQKLEMFKYQYSCGKTKYLSLKYEDHKDNDITDNYEYPVNEIIIKIIDEATPVIDDLKKAFRSVADAAILFGISAQETAEILKEMQTIKKPTKKAKKRLDELGVKTKIKQHKAAWQRHRNSKSRRYRRNR